VKSSAKGQVLSLGPTQRSYRGLGVRRASEDANGAENGGTILSADADTDQDVGPEGLSLRQSRELNFSQASPTEMLSVETLSLGKEAGAI
jgi:hypothetical protein